MSKADVIEVEGTILECFRCSLRMAIRYWRISAAN